MLLTTCPHLLRSDTPRTAVVVSGVLRIKCSLCGTVGMPARRPVYGGRKDWSVPEGGQTFYHGTAAPGRVKDVAARVREAVMEDEDVDEIIATLAISLYPHKDLRMRDIGIPNGLTAIGYTERDIPSLIDGTLRQPRLLAGAPRSVGAADLELIQRDSMQYW